MVANAVFFIPETLPIVSLNPSNVAQNYDEVALAGQASERYRRRLGVYSFASSWG